MHVWLNFTANGLCRYLQAVRCLRLESRALQQGPQMSLAPQPDPKKGLVEDLLYFLTAEDNPGRYALGFDRLAAWVDSSLDQYQVC
jgi:hypothetical protein